MSLNRLTLSVFATLFSVVPPSLASASDAAVPIAIGPGTVAEIASFGESTRLCRFLIRPIRRIPSGLRRPTIPTFRASRAHTMVAMPFTIRPI